MAERIIYRGRPRADKPYPFQIEVAAIPETADYFLFGPLTIDELMEFKYRIKKFTVTGSITVEGTPTEEDPSPTNIISFNYDIIRSKLLVRLSGGGFFGILQSKTQAYEKESEFTPSFINKFLNLFADKFYKERPEYVAGITIESIDMSSTEPYKTDAGYYLPIIIGLYGTNEYGFGGFGTVNRGEEEVEGEIYTDIQLKVGSKTHNIRCRVYATETVIGGSLTIEASEWWPYANADGQPIWNTATGARTTNPFS